MMFRVPPNFIHGCCSGLARDCPRWMDPDSFYRNGSRSDPTTNTEHGSASIAMDSHRMPWLSLERFRAACCMQASVTVLGIRRWIRLHPSARIAHKDVLRFPLRAVGANALRDVVHVMHRQWTNAPRISTKRRTRAASNDGATMRDEFVGGDVIRHLRRGTAFCMFVHVPRRRCDGLTPVTGTNREPATNEYTSAPCQVQGIASSPRRASSARPMPATSHRTIGGVIRPKIAEHDASVWAMFAH